MREILLHGGSEEIFDHSVLFAKRIDLAIVQASTSGGSGMAAARALLEHGRCAVLVLR